MLTFSSTSEQEDNSPDIYYSAPSHCALNIRVHLERALEAAGIPFAIGKDIAYQTTREKTSYTQEEGVLTISHALLDKPGVRQVIEDNKDLFRSAYMIADEARGR